MGSKIYTKISGAWKQVKKIHVKVGGTWKQVKYAYVKVGGVWKKIHSYSFVFSQTISSSSTTPYNLKAAAIAAGWDQVTPLVATVTINSGVNQQSNALATPAFDTGATFPAGTVLSLVNNGTITGYAGTAGSYGAGGAGGTGGWGGSYGNPGNTGGTGSAGGTGGIALKAQYAISVTNGSGSLIGGAGGAASVGGGGGGGGSSGWVDGESRYYEGSVGGTGQGPSAAQNGVNNGNYAYSGRGGNYGSAGYPGDASGPTAADGIGASGGAAGGAGAAGARGNYINGNANVTWVSTGTRTGTAV